MNKFCYSALLNELYQEILFVTYNYQKETIGDKELSKLDNTDYTNLSKSKNIQNFYSNITLVDLGQYYIDERVLSILEARVFDYDRLKTVVDFLNPYISYYRSEMKKVIDAIGDVLDIKEKENGFKGTYPLYLKLSESNCLIERAVISTNAQEFLNKTNKKFGYKVSFMDYDVPLKDYSYKGTDLREKSREEIIKVMESSVKIELNNSKYYMTEVKEMDISKEDLDLGNIGELSLWLNKKTVTYSGLKDALKGSLKHSLYMLLLIVIVSAVLLVMKYLIK